MNTQEQYGQNRDSHERRLDSFTCEELCEVRFPRERYIVDTLLSPGLAVLAGSPKVGKSWFVLSLCVQIAKGTPFLGLDTHKGTALYIALEDSEQRLQKRMLKIGDDAPEGLYFAVKCAPMGDEFARQLINFTEEHPDTQLIVIDTLQRIRGGETQMSYANDYVELTWLKQLADRLKVCLLLVHHTRKMGDSDAFNEISGTNGIAGSADTLMVLKKEKRSDRKAVLTCTGRDVEDREMELLLDRNSCVWELKSDTLVRPANRGELPREILMLAEYMKRIEKFEGGNSAFTDGFNKTFGMQMTPSALKRLMNLYRYELEDRGVQFCSLRRPKGRVLMIYYFRHKDTFAPQDDAAPAAMTT